VTVVGRVRRRNAILAFILGVVAVVLATARLAAAAPCAIQIEGQPSLVELRRVARTRAGLAEVPHWRGRARTAALLPLVTLRAARALDWDDGGDYTGSPIEVGNNVVFEARLTWRLDRLVFEPAEPRLDGVERDAHRARSALDAEVTRLYFRWRRAMLAATAIPDDASRRLDAEEAWAELDARTGGWLGERGCPR